MKRISLLSMWLCLSPPLNVLKSVHFLVHSEKDLSLGNVLSAWAEHKNVKMANATTQVGNMRK